MDPWQILPVVSNIALYPAVAVSFVQYKWFALPFIAFAAVLVNSWIMHTCRMVGPDNCAYLDEWMFIDYLGSQFLVAVIACLLRIDLKIGQRDILIGIWFIAHTLLFALGFIEWISIVIAAFFAFNNIIVFWHKFNKVKLIVSLIMGFIGIIFYPITLPKAAVLAHTIWHLDVMTSVSIIVLMISEVYSMQEEDKFF